MDTLLKLVISLTIVVAGLASLLYLKDHEPEPTTHSAQNRIQSVAVKRVTPKSVSIPVHSRGEVRPTIEIQLVLEVAGVVNYVSPHLVNGGFFEKDEVLLRIDDSRYRLDITKAKARLVSAQEKYRRLRSELTIDEEIAGLSAPKENRKLRLRELKAQVEAAKADVRLVTMQVEKTVLKAPFKGRVSRAMVGSGQYISPGMQLAQVYPVDAAEVRLPLSDRQLALVNIPNTPDQIKRKPKVNFKLHYGGRAYHWEGKVVRTEGGLDAKNRILYAVAKIANPYTVDPSQPDRPPLAAGQFLEAEIEGRTHDNVFVLPRNALRNGNEIWTVDGGRLHQKSYELLHKSRDSIFVRQGLKAGDLVVLTPMDITIEGMQVRATRKSKSRTISPNRSRTSRAYSDPNTKAFVKAG